MLSEVNEFVALLYELTTFHAINHYVEGHPYSTDLFLKKLEKAEIVSATDKSYYRLYMRAYIHFRKYFYIEGDVNHSYLAYLELLGHRVRLGIPPGKKYSSILVHTTKGIFVV